jgi:SWI/SNF-related matrix-associated actin-dependent regulator 1 of chromatin subfamily A
MVRILPASVVTTLTFLGSLSERAIARAEMDWETPYVIVTGYKTVSRPEDHRFLRKRNFNVCVFDEGHTLKNSETQQYEKLLRIPAKFRVLLTGTPLQNNLSELATLLTFLLPNVFLVLKDDLKAIFSHKAKTSDDEHAGLLSAQRIRRAKSMLAPFILRRKKEQVSLKTLPAKHRRIQDCVLPPAHQAIYDGELTQGLQKARDRNAGIKVARATNTNLTTTLRYAAIHPLLLRKIFNDKILGEITQILMDIGGYSSYNKLYEELAAYNDFQLHQLCKSNGGSLEKYALHNDEWMQSGKVDALIALLQEYEANGDRALVFSQYKLVLDILEPVLNTLGFKYQRLDGSTPTDLRLTLINDFADDPTILVFLLTTKAGGVGINLPCANKVVIFDIGHNPQEEIQAENRAHRVGQTREVEVVRLLALNTVEKNMWRMQEAKMLLDERVTGAPVQEEKVVQGEGEGEGTVMERIIDELLDEDEVKKNSEGGEDEGKDVGRGAKKDVEVMELDDKTN